jgi:hypothetical protein
MGALEFTGTFLPKKKLTSASLTKAHTGTTHKTLLETKQQEEHATSLGKTTTSIELFFGGQKHHDTDSS